MHAQVLEYDEWTKNYVRILTFELIARETNLQDNLLSFDEASNGIRCSCILL